MYQNYTFSNDFVGCLCVGGRSTGPPLGNETFLSQMGICSTCSATPEKTKSDLTVRPPSPGFGAYLMPCRSFYASVLSKRAMAPQQTS